MYLWDRAGRAPVTVSYPEAFDDLMPRIGLGIAGTPAQVGQSIRRLSDQAGVNYFVCRLAFGDLSFEEAARSLDLLADRVMPALAPTAVDG